MQAIHEKAYSTASINHLVIGGWCLYSILVVAGHFTKGCLSAHLWTCTHFMKRYLLPHGLDHMVVGGWYPAVLPWWEKDPN
jgi:hypothetical protein